MRFWLGQPGKLRLILAELADDCVEPVVLAGNDRTRRQAEQTLGRMLIAVPRLQDAECALVINDPRAADRAHAAGLPVLYVDSLPYLWTLPSEVPGLVEVYCAQQLDGGGPWEGGPLDGRADVTWIEPIVPRRRSERSAVSGCLVNVGGMHSHASAGAEDAYVELVVVPAVGALLDRGQQIRAVCGNLAPAMVSRLSSLLPSSTHIGALSGASFEDAVLDSELLVTSPGSTTVLQAASAGTDLLMLPPQNVSQVLNSKLLSRSSR